MELQFNSKDWGCLRRVARETASQELTQELRLPDGMPDIGRVLGSWGQVILRSKEWVGDTVTVTGGVMVWVLYGPEDGSEPRGMDTWIPFQLRWNRMDARQEGPLRIMPVLRFADARTVSPRKFMIRAGIMALAEAFCMDTCQIYAPDDLPEDVQVCRRTYPVRLPKEAGEKTFQIDEDLELSGPEVGKLLSYTLNPVVTETKVLTNRIALRGNCNLHLVYQCGEGRIRIRDFEVPFSQYADLNGTYGADGSGEVQLAVTNLELNQEEGKLRFKCALVAQYLVDDRAMVELVEDAYSPRRQVSLKSEMLNLPAILERRREELPVLVHLKGISGEVVDVFPSFDHPNQRSQPEGVAMEIPGFCQVLYQDETGMPQTATTRWEVNHSLPADENSRILSVGRMDGNIVSVTGSHGLELRGQMELQLETVSDAGMNMVTGLELGEEQEPNPDRPSLILRRLDGCTIWELAKRCGSTPDGIRTANNLQEEPEPGRMLLIPIK